MKLLLTFILLMASQISLSLPTCELENKNIRDIIPKLCEENILCWNFADGAQCSISQSTKNYKDGLDMNDEDFSNVVRFRNLFYSELSPKNKKNAHNIILLPSSELLRYPDSKSEEEFRDILRQYSPNHMSKASKEFGFTDLGKSEQTAPISLFFFRGSPSEFNTNEPLSDFDWSSSSLYKKWKAKMRSISHKDKLVKAYSYEHAEIRDFSIEALVDVYSIDDKNGKAIVNIVSFRTDVATFESNEANETIIPRFIERITLIDSLIELPNLYLMSHSMGSMRSLEIVSRLHNSDKPAQWFHRLKGILSIGGVIWGSASGEVSTIEGEGFNVLYENLTKIAAIKEDKIRNQPQEVLEEIFGYVAKMGAAYNKTYKSVAVEGIEPSYPITPQLIRLLNAIKNGLKKGSSMTSFAANNDTNNIANGKMMELLKVLNLKNHLYDGTLIVKMQRMIKNFKVKIEDIREKNRIKWFKTHTLPSNIRYVSFAATMADPFSYLLSKSDDDHLENKGFFYKHAADYQIQKSSQYDAFYNDKIRLSDGSTSYHHNIFLARKHQKLNPKQELYKTENIALFASDHLGILLGSAYKGENPSFNHFPRVTMLKALARYLEEK